MADKPEITSKICTGCGFIKPAAIKYFQKRKSAKDGFRGKCSACLKKRYAKYYIENRERAIERANEYVANNKEKVIAYQAEYRENNKEVLAEYFKEYQESNKAVRNKREAKRRKKDPKFRLNGIISGGIKDSLKKGKGGRSWLKLVDFTISELESKLKHSIPKGFTWADFLNGKLHLDHVLPISKFNFVKPEDDDFKRCWALENLSLLPAIDNIKKGNKLKKPLQMGLIFG